MPRRLKIALIAACPFPAPRGTPIRALRTAQALAELGHTVDVVTYHLGDSSALPQTDGLSVHRIPAVGFYKKVSPGPSFSKLAILDLLLVREALKVGKRQKPDLVYVHHYEGLLIGLAIRRRLNCPVVYDAHTTLEAELSSYFSKTWQPVARRIGSRMDTELPKRADHTVAVTEAIATRLRPYLAQKSGLSVISNGVEIGHFTKARWAPNSNDKRTRNVIFTGNMAPYQGVELLLEAFASLRRRRSDVRLRIVTNDDFGRYRATARKLNLVAEIDVVSSRFESLPDELAGADVAVNPRVVGPGIPQKLLNYMAVGMPIVSFDGIVRGLSENEIGLLVPDGDVEAFATAIDRLLDDRELALELGGLARQAVTSMGDWRTTGSRLEQVFFDVLAR